MSKEKYNRPLTATLASRVVKSAQKFAEPVQSGTPATVCHRALVRHDVQFDGNSFSIGKVKYSVSFVAGPPDDSGKATRVYFIRTSAGLVETCRSAQDIHYAVLKLLSADGGVYRALLPGKTELVFLAYSREAVIEMKRVEGDVYTCPNGHSWRLRKIDGDKSYWTPIKASDGRILMGLPHAFEVREEAEVLAESKPFNLSMLFA